MKLRDLKKKKVTEKAIKQDVIKQDVTMTGAVSEVFRFYASKGL